MSDRADEPPFNSRGFPPAPCSDPACDRAGETHWHYDRREPDGADEPPSDWPTCDNAMVVLGYDLRCTLPQDHALDGSQWHRNDEGVEWLVTRDDDEGTDVSLLGFPLW